MRVRWTTDAADDLERICDYVAETSPDSARRVARTIVEGIASLHTFPNRGRLAGSKALASSCSRLYPSSLSTKCTMKCWCCESCTALNGGRQRETRGASFRPQRDQWIHARCSASWGSIGACCARIILAPLVSPPSSSSRGSSVGNIQALRAPLGALLAHRLQPEGGRADEGRRLSGTTISRGDRSNRAVCDDPQASSTRSTW